MSSRNQWEVNDLHVPHTQPERGHGTVRYSAGLGRLCCQVRIELSCRKGSAGLDIGGGPRTLRPHSSSLLPHMAWIPVQRKWPWVTCSSPLAAGTLGTVMGQQGGAIWGHRARSPGHCGWGA